MLNSWRMRLDILKVHVLQHLAGECFYKQLIMALSGLDFCYQIFSRLMLPWRTIKLNRVVSVSGRAKDKSELVSFFDVPVQTVRHLICCLFTVRSNSTSTNTSRKSFDFSEGFWESKQNVYKTNINWTTVVRGRDLTILNSSQSWNWFIIAWEYKGESMCVGICVGFVVWYTVCCYFYVHICPNIDLGQISKVSKG